MSGAEMLAEVVRNGGYIPVIDGAMIDFKVEGTPYRIETYPEDVDYVRMMVAFAVPSDITSERLMATANDANRSMKAVKVVVNTTADDRCVRFTIESFLGGPPAWETGFERALFVLRHASDEFYRIARERVAS